MSSPRRRAASAVLLGVVALGGSFATAAAPAVSAAETTFTSSPNVAITDGGYGGTFASMSASSVNATIPSGHIVTDITVTVAITHTFVGDLTIKLRSPRGTILALLERPRGDGSANNVGDNGADSPYGDASNLNATYPVQFHEGYPTDADKMGLGLGDGGTVCKDDLKCYFAPNPDEALTWGRSVNGFRPIYGEFATGSWTLGVGDSAGGDAGTLVSWSIALGHEMGRRVTYAGPAGGFGFSDNTYNGSFTNMQRSTVIPSGIPAGDVVTSVTVDFRANHTYVGDLTIKLSSPAGTVLALVERPQGDDGSNNLGDNGTDQPAGDSSNLTGDQLTFNDVYQANPEEMGAGIGNTQDVCDHDGRCQFFAAPDQALVAGRSVANFAAFDGQNPTGEWTLGFGDSFAGDTGSFEQWHIVIGFTPPLTSCAEPPFSDVAIAHPFCSQIKWMKTAEVGTGFSDGTYRPDEIVTRQAMSAFIARLAGASLTPCTFSPFSDVPVGHPFCAEIKWMKSSGISTGFDDGTYRPTLVVTRQAMSAFLARVSAQRIPPCTTRPFTDVSEGDPFCPQIKWMKETSISTGFSDGTYRPSAEVTRQAMAAFMNRAIFQIP